MYPHTTSLYSATVIDSTTYCRQDDDIIVVEFDGDEPGEHLLCIEPLCLLCLAGVLILRLYWSSLLLDPTGALPKYHIPARFVTLIPREFPASQTNSKKRKSVTSAQAPLLPNASSKSKRSSVSSTKSNDDNSNNIDNTDPLLEDDPLGNMIGQMGFDDLMATNSLEDLGEFDFDFSEDAK
jgi:hypothetical protein